MTRPLPAGSARALRDSLRVEEAKIRETINGCAHCNKLRAEASRLANEAEHLWPQIMAELDAEAGTIRVKKVVYRPRKEQPDDSA